MDPQISPGVGVRQRTVGQVYADAPCITPFSFMYKENRHIKEEPHFLFVPCLVVTNDNTNNIYFTECVKSLNEKINGNGNLSYKITQL
jgi:hypothetical protein